MSQVFVEVFGKVNGVTQEAPMVTSIVEVSDGMSLAATTELITETLQKFFDESETLYYVDVPTDLDVVVSLIPVVKAEDAGTVLGALLSPILTKRSEREYDNDCADFDVDLG